MNFGFEMSECFKQSETLPRIAEHEANDSTSVQDLKKLILRMTAFHDHDRIHIGAVEETLKHIMCELKIPLCKQKITSNLSNYSQTIFGHICLPFTPLTCKLVDYFSNYVINSSKPSNQHRFRSCQNTRTFTKALL